MRLLVNGMQKNFREGTTISELLEVEEEPAGHVIVEVGGQFIPAHDYGSRILEEGDQVEIILPAFGG